MYNLLVLVTYVTTLLRLSRTAFASPHTFERRASGPLISTVYQYEKVGQGLENIAVRSSGELLVTRIDVPELWLVKPKQRQAKKLYAFPNATFATGITEFKDDVFAVVTGGITLDPPATIPKSAVVWKVDLSGRQPAISVLKAIPEADTLNGITTLDRQSGILLITDCTRARVWRLNTQTGDYSIALADPTMAAADPKKDPVGVNGIRVHKNYVYYTSSTQQLFCRVKVDKEGSAIGPFETIVNAHSYMDDFALAKDGTAYIATNEGNSIIKVTPHGELTTVIGGLNSTVLAGPTSCQLSRKDDGLLYVVTGGAVRFPVNGVFREPAKVAAVRLQDRDY